MSEPMIVWAIIIAVLVLAFVFRSIEKFRKMTKRKNHIIECGTEKEMFFCPGDKRIWDEFDDM